MTPELCAELLNRPKFHDDPAEFRVYSHSSAKEATQTPEGTLGAALEQALRANDELCLAAALLDDAKRLVSLVEEEVKRRRAEANSLNETAIASWTD